MNYDEAVDELQSSLKDAVESRLVSDVPVGMFLSGGVDSNTIACLIRNATPARLMGRCGGGDRSEDFAAARQCAQHVDFDFEEVRVGADDYRESWQSMLDEYATPLSTPTDVILHRLAREMKKSVGVVLGGEGADELLCGYTIPHWAGVDYDNLRKSESTGDWPHAHAGRLFRDSMRRHYGRDHFLSETDHFFASNSLIPTLAKPSLMQPWAWQQADEDRRMWDVYSRLHGELGGQTTAERQTRVLHRVNLEGLLSRLDSATMMASLEARVPYTDHTLVEKMFAVPRQFKIDVAADEQAPYLASAELDSRGSLRSKRLLRSVAARLMPTSLAHRKKASFPTPVASWMSGPWAQYVRGKLLGSPFGQAVFRPEAMRELADNLPQAGMWLWPLLNVLEWGDRQFADA